MPSRSQPRRLTLTRASCKQRTQSPAIGRPQTAGRRPAQGERQGDVHVRSISPACFTPCPWAAPSPTASIARSTPAPLRRCPAFAGSFSETTSARSSACREPITASRCRIGGPRPPFEDDEIRYYGQYVAVVVAETFEQDGRRRRRQGRVSGEKPNVAPHLTADTQVSVESERGDADKALVRARCEVDQTYVTPAETHNTIELHASVAVWDGRPSRCTRRRRASSTTRTVLAQMLGRAEGNVRVSRSSSARGSAASSSPGRSALAAAAREARTKPVKLVLTRKMNSQTVGHRPRTQQRMRLGAHRRQAHVVQHDYPQSTRRCSTITRRTAANPRLHVQRANLRVTSALARRNVGTPPRCAARARCPGSVRDGIGDGRAGDALKMDPLQLR